MAGLILDGLRVVDLSWGLAGPVAAQILAEVGADVVKVEPPTGDPIRRLHPAAFATWNRSKRGVVLNDLDDPRLAALLDRADVLIHSLRGETARRHGLDEAALRARYPRLVIGAISGYPPGHADYDRPGYDLLVQAREGLTDIQAGWRDGPFAWRFYGPSWAAAYLGASGVLARLIHRERTGRGGLAATSLAQGVHLLQNLMWNRASNPSPSMEVGHPGTLVTQQIAMYQCSDGRWIQILNPADRIDITGMPLLKKAIAELGLDGVPFDADVMRAAVKQYPTEDWLAEIRALDVAVEELSDLGAVLVHPEAVANDFSIELDDPVWGRVRQSSQPFQGDFERRVRNAAPTLGQHTETVFTELADVPVPAVPAATSPRADEPPLPLTGIRVVDFGAFLAGPLAPMLLGDLGADVISVEPLTGEPQRNWRDNFYIACNRSKRAIALDINHPRGRDVVDRLIRWTDVVHHNMRARSAARLRMDAAAVEQLNPRAIYSHGASYGLRGDRADWPGYDSVFQAIGGWNVVNAGDGNPPLFCHLGCMDTLTATSSAMVTLLSLYHRERTGEIVHVEAALLNTAAFTNSETMVTLADGLVAPYPVLDDGQNGLSAGYRLYEVADEWIAIAALTDRALAALLAVAGVHDPDELPAALASRSPGELLTALAAADVPAETVRQFRYFDVWDDAENLRTGAVVAYPQHDWGELRQFGAFWNFGDLALDLTVPPPALGEHNAEILRELGYDDAAITALAEGNAITTTPVD
jgi:crotonobetainyl-CoA:carnitine CoA-transferase CaiB-like acyl-CoA transferase